MNELIYAPGKLPHAVLARLISDYTHRDPRLVVPPVLGEDAAVIDFGDRYLVAKTDPITFASDAIGWYAVHVNANDIAAMGATPRFFLATVLLPEGQASEEMTRVIFESIHNAASSLGVVVCGGHTEITHGIDRPLVIGQMLGETTPERLVRSSGLEPGDAILLTKGLAIEATAIIAREKKIELLERGYASDLLARAAAYLSNPGISVVPEASIASATASLHAMHDPTEGGVITALSELATASEVGLEICADELFITNESAALCGAFDLDPFGIISSGALLIGCAATDADSVQDALAAANIAVRQIGTARERSFGLQLRRHGQLEDLPHFPVDEITKIFQDES